MADSAVQILFPSINRPFDFLGHHYSARTDSPIYSLRQLATIVPSLALLVRRLHDTNRSGKKAWWHLLPAIGWIIVLVYTLEKGSTEANGFGEPAI